MKLTPSQRRVFVGINAYPWLNDSQLARKIGMKRSTVTAARSFLKENEYYKSYLFPSFERMGIPIIGWSFGNYSKVKALGFSQRMNMRPHNMRTPEYFFSLSTNFSGLSICFSKEVDVLYEAFAQWRRLLLDHDSSFEMREVFLPSELVREYRFMNSIDLLASVLGVEPLHPPEDFVEVKKLTTRDRIVLQAWVQKPNASNEELSEEIGISRTSIGIIKKRLLKRKMAKVICLPNWHKIGMGLGVMCYVPLKEFCVETVRAVARHQNIILCQATKYEILYYGVFKNYSDFLQVQRELLGGLRERCGLLTEPVETIFPLEELKHSITTSDVIVRGIS